MEPGLLVEMDDFQAMKATVKKINLEYLLVLEILDVSMFK